MADQRAKNIIEIWMRAYHLQWDGTPTWSDLELLADAFAAALRAYGDARERARAEEDAKIRKAAEIVVEAWGQEVSTTSLYAWSRWLPALG